MKSVRSSPVAAFLLDFWLLASTVLNASCRAADKNKAASCQRDSLSFVSPVAVKDAPYSSGALTL